MHNRRRYPYSKWGKMTKNAVLNLALCCGAIWRQRENRNIGAQLQSILYTTAEKKIFANLLPVGLLVRTNLFIPSRFLDYRYEIWHLLCLCVQYSNVWKFFLYRCTSTFSALSYSSGIFFKSLRCLYEVVRTNFSADFLDFSQFLTAISRKLWRYLATNVRTM